MSDITARQVQFQLMRRAAGVQPNLERQRKLVTILQGVGRLELVVLATEILWRMEELHRLMREAVREDE